MVLDDGRPLAVAGGEERSGRGPWARLVASAIVPDERGPAERGRKLARERHVHSLAVGPGRDRRPRERQRRRRLRGRDHSGGRSAARVGGGLGLAPGKAAARAALEGRAQSVHLEHEMRSTGTSRSSRPAGDPPVVHLPRRRLQRHLQARRRARLRLRRPDRPRSVAAPPLAWVRAGGDRLAGAASRPGGAEPARRPIPGSAGRSPRSGRRARSRSAPSSSASAEAASASTASSSPSRSSRLRGVRRHGPHSVGARPCLAPVHRGPDWHLRGRSGPAQGDSRWRPARR